MADTILDTAATVGVLTTAASVSGTIDATPISGSFDTTLDHDWYAITLTAGHTYSFGVRTTSFAFNDITLGVMDANRNVLDSQGVVDEGNSALVSYAAPVSGTYYVAVGPGGSNPASLTGTYILAAQDLGADTVLDTTATNASLTIGGSVSGQIDAIPMPGSSNTTQDHDWYAVNLTAGHTYAFGGTTSGNLNDLAFDLRDASGNIVGQVDSAVGNPVITFVARTAGTYYLDVSAGGSNASNLTGGYTILASDEGADTVLDTSATTATLSMSVLGVMGKIDPVPVSGSFNTSFDVDWYAVSLTAGHTYAFSVEDLTGGILSDLAIDVRNASRAILDAQGVVDNGGGFANVIYTPTTTGIYYVEVSPGGSNPASLTGQYNVSASDLGIEPPDTVLDTPATTASLVMNGTVSGSLDVVPASASFNTAIDHDWYAVSLTAGERYTFSAAGTGLSDIAISLMNASRTVVDTQGVVDGGFGLPATISFTAPTSGIYYLDVRGGGSNPASETGGYQLTATDKGPDHLVLNLVPDASVTQHFGANYQTSAFWTGVEAAANFFETNFFDPITVTIDVGWGEVNGTTVPSHESESRRNQTNFTFNQIVTALTKDAQSTDDATAVAHLPTQDPGPGGTDFKIADAEARALGLSTTVPAQDGFVGFATDWNPTDANFVGVVEHEISEVLGRGSGINASTGVFTGAYSVLDLFRYSAGPPVTAEPSAATGPGGSTYFSIDGGATALKTFSSIAGEDPGGDWAAGGGNDAFNAILPNGPAPVSAADLTEMDVLGYDTQPQPIPVASGGIDYRVPVNGSTTLTPTSYIGASAIASAGYRFAIEYIGTANNTGYLRASDSSALVQQGLSIVSVYAKAGMLDRNADGSYSSAWVSYFNNHGALGQGTADAIDAINAARAAGQTSGAIYFDVNVDQADARSGITQAAALAEIGEYLREINTYFTQHGAPYSIGAFGAGATLSSLQADASTGVKYTWLSDTWLNEIGAVASKNLEQTDTSGGAMVGGQPVDLDTAYTADFGQWSTVTNTVAAAVKNDFDANAISDVLWRDGSTGDWGWSDISNGAASHSLGNLATNYSVVGVGDFNGDKAADALWRDNATGAWGWSDISNGAASHSLGTSTASYSVVGVGDFNKDGTADVLFRDNATGAWGWSDIGNHTVWHSLGNSTASYSVVGIGDFNGDGTADVLFRDNATGAWGWSDLANHNAWHSLGTSTVGYSVVGVGDFNGDGKADALWRNDATGDTGWSDINNHSAWHSLGASSTALSIVSVGDFNGDKSSDVLWRNSASGDWSWSDISNGNVSHPLGNLATNYRVVS